MLKKSVVLIDRGKLLVHYITLHKLLSLSDSVE